MTFFSNSNPFNKEGILQHEVGGGAVEIQNYVIAQVLLVDNILLKIPMIGIFF